MAVCRRKFKCLRCAYCFTVLASCTKRGSVRCPRCQGGELKPVWGLFGTSGLGGGGCHPLAKEG